MHGGIIGEWIQFFLSKIDNFCCNISHSFSDFDTRLFQRSFQRCILEIWIQKTITFQTCSMFGNWYSYFLSLVNIPMVKVYGLNCLYLAYQLKFFMKSGPLFYSHVFKYVSLSSSFKNIYSHVYKIFIISFSYIWKHLSISWFYTDLCSRGCITVTH